MPGPSGPSPRLIGLLLAGILAAVFAVVIWMSIESPSQTSSNDSAFGDERDVPGIGELEEGASMFVTIVDKDDPTRISGTLEADQFEPIGGGRRRLLEPRVWIYARDGRAIHVVADSGVLLMPDPNDTPESGTLEGNVTIRIYSETPGPGVPALVGSTPELIARFDEPVEFERRYLRLTSAGEFNITGDRLDFSGADLTVMLNDLQDRVELVEVKRGDQLVLRPERGETTSRAPIAPSVRRHRVVRAAYQPSGGDLAAPIDDQQAIDAVVDPVPDPDQVLIPLPDPTPYHTRFEESVRVELVGRGVLTSGILDLWTNIVDGSLPEGAIRDVAFVSEESQSDPESSIEDAVREDIDEVPGGAYRRTRSLPIDDGDVVITWDGPLVVRPMDDLMSSGILANDDVVLEVSGSDGVSFESDDQVLLGSADTMRYNATRAVLAMGSEQDNGVEIRSQGSGVMLASDLSADLVRGHIDIDSGGSITGVVDSDGNIPQVSWTQIADFVLLKDDEDRLTGRLTRAAFQGDVLGSSGDAVVTAHRLVTALSESGDVAAALRSVTITDGEMRSRDGSLRGDSMRISFATDPSGQGVTPTALRASGAVFGVAREGRITTESLDARLALDDLGELTVSNAQARGATEFLGENDTRALGTQIDLDTPTDTIVIGGDNARASQGGSEISGETITINTRRRSVLVDGPGSFAHRIVAEGRPTGGRLDVSWITSMRFDDAIGTITCVGDVEAVSTPDALTRDTLNAERVEIELTPAPLADRIVGPDQFTSDQSPDEPERELLMARAFGRAVPGEEPVFAKVESRSYDESNPERASGVLFLEGPEIVADNEAQTLTVPSAGTLVVLDRQDRDASGDPSETSVGSTGPGLTRLTWTGSLVMDRASGDARVRRGVTVRHKSLTTARVSDLTCETLIAGFTPMRSDEPVQITMRSLEASGRVRFFDSDRTLLSDRAFYDAINETLFASAEGNTLVTLRDASEPAPLSAKTLLWDLASDEIEIDAPSPIRAPVRP